MYANFPGTLKTVTLITDHMGVRIVDLVDKLQKPVFIYMANGGIKSLEKIKHNKQVQAHLESEGVHIYLYEPICSYYVDDPESPKNIYLERVRQDLATPDLIDEPYNRIPFNSGFYSEFPNYPVSYRATELDSIYKYAENNNLTNITVHTCDHNAGKFYRAYSNRMKLVYDDLYLNSTNVNCNASTAKKTHFEKRFVCLNWRFTPFRAIIASILCKKSAHLSWYFRCKDKHLRDVVWLKDHFQKDVALYKRLVMSLDKLNSGSPWLVDLHVDQNNVISLEKNWHSHYYPDIPELGSANPSTENNHYAKLENVYRESFVDIVCETRYAQPTGLISEKMLQSMQYLTPFVAVAPPRTLQCLRSLGFKTFDKWWDESYDTEKNHGERMKKIIQVIDHIEGLSESEIFKMYKQMRPVLLHNLKNLAKLSNAQTGYQMSRQTLPQLVQWVTTDDRVTELSEDHTNEE